MEISGDLVLIIKKKPKGSFSSSHPVTRFFFFCFFALTRRASWRYFIEKNYRSLQECETKSLQRLRFVFLQVLESMPKQGIHVMATNSKSQLCSDEIAWGKQQTILYIFLQKPMTLHFTICHCPKLFYWVKLRRASRKIHTFISTIFNIHIIKDVHNFI